MTLASSSRRVPAPSGDRQPCGIVDGLLGLTSAEFVAAARARGVAPPQALSDYRRWFRAGEPPPGLAPWAPLIPSTQTDGQTTKFTLRMADGLESESVVIPMRRGDGATTWTLCVSSQVGCAMGCAFCETAQMGLVRHLKPGEIVAQWHAARHALNRAIKNIVFMGMGEPMDNLDAVLQAIRVLTDHNGPAVPASNIAVSTVGRLDGIARLAEFVRQPGFGRLNLAVSVNAPNDQVRSRLMPVNRGMPMAALMKALRAWPLRGGGAVCVEYVLIPGVNDAPEHADELCAWLRPLRCSLNVIPYNPRRDSPWRAPTEEEVRAFVSRAVANGQFVKRRGTKGRAVMGACGQLGNPEIRRRRHVAAAPRGAGTLSAVTVEGRIAGAP